MLLYAQIYTSKMTEVVNMYIIIWKFKIKADIADLFLNFEIWLEFCH